MGTKANNVSTWKAVCFSCLSASEFRLAATCGLEVIKYPDHVEEVVIFYSDLGHFTHLVSLFEQGLGLEDGHIGIFTELGILYTKHVPEKVMEHCKVFFSKLNTGKVVKACERARLYSPAVYLYMQDKQYDNAVKVMMERTPAFDNDLFLDSIVKVRNTEIMYKAVNFYLTIHPTIFTRLMEIVEEHVDHSRVVSQLRRSGDWALQVGQSYMKNVQKADLSAVNEALNELYIEDEDYEGLRTSIEMSKADRMYKDCIDTANESCDPEIIEKLLRFFCETSEKECFCATLYTCFAHVNPDVVLELGWIHGYHNFIMPFLIQHFQHNHNRLKALEETTKPAEEEVTQQDEVAGTYGNLNGFGGMLQISNGESFVPPVQMAGNNGVPDMSGFGGPGM